MRPARIVCIGLLCFFFAPPFTFADDEQSQATTSRSSGLEIAGGCSDFIIYARNKSDTAALFVESSLGFVEDAYSIYEKERYSTTVIIHYKLPSPAFKVWYAEGKNITRNICAGTSALNTKSIASSVYHAVAGSGFLRIKPFGRSSRPDTPALITFVLNFAEFKNTNGENGGPPMARLAFSGPRYFRIQDVAVGRSRR